MAKVLNGVAPLLSDLQGPGRELALAYLWDSMSADFASRNVELIGAFAKDLAARYPKYAGELGPVLVDLFEQIMTKQEADPNNKQLLGIADEVAAAAFAVTPDEHVSELMAAFDLSTVRRLGAALVSRVGELTETPDRVPDRILKVILAGPPTKEGKELAKTFLFDAPSPILERLGERLYSVIARATRAPYDPQDKLAGRAALNDTRQFTAVMTNPVILDLMNMSRSVREALFAERERAAEEFPKTAGAAMAFLTPLLALSDVDTWLAWQKDHDLGRPGQVYAGLLEHAYAINLALTPANSLEEADPALVRRVKETVIANLYQGGDKLDLDKINNDEWRVEPQRVYVFDKGISYSMPAIQVTANGKTVTVAVDRNGMIKAFPDAEAWLDFISADITDKSAPPLQGVLAIPQVEDDGRVKIRVRAVANPVFGAAPSGRSLGTRDRAV
jgi:hypothetical protein